jgi:hypothetical protein
MHLFYLLKCNIQRKGCRARLSSQASSHRFAEHKYELPCTEALNSEHFTGVYSDILHSMQEILIGIHRLFTL